MDMSKSDSKKQILKAPKGMRDILFDERVYWDEIHKKVNDISQAYSFSRIDTPILESSDIFERTLGETSDVVEKQMFFVKTKDNATLVLRPEGTSPLVRAYIEHGLDHLPQPLKAFYMGPMFRYEQPQAGRLRQFHQVGFEVIGGESDPIYDAQIIVLINRLLRGLGIKNIVTEINSLGCKACRLNYKRKLIAYYKEKKGKMCEDCERRLALNPLRLLDCKEEKCLALRNEAPSILDHLCKSCNIHFKQVLEFIEEMKIPYRLNHFLVRGLDYYNRTVFEIFADGALKQKEAEKHEEEVVSRASSKLALASGGRYDFLGEILGSRSISAVGVAMGIERVIELLKKYNIIPKPLRKKRIFFVYIGETAKKKSLPIIDALIDAGFNVMEALGKESLKAQLRLADKERIEWALIFGQKEAFEDSVILRDMKTGAQEAIALKSLTERLHKKLGARV